MIKCELCGKDSIIKVAENGGMNFFSCCNEECIDFSELLVETNGGLERVHTMLNAYKDVIQEITDEKYKIRRS